MATLRVTNLRGRTGNQSPTLPDGVVVTGVTTSTSFDGNLNASQLASGTIPDDRFPATLPAVNGSALTDLNIPEGFSELDAGLFN